MSFGPRAGLGLRATETRPTIDHPTAPAKDGFAEPSIERREALPYAGLARKVTHGIAAAVDDGFPNLFGWLGERGIEPAGPPLIRYLEVDHEGGPLRIELGVPTAGPIEPDDLVRTSELPAGSYAVMIHSGPYRHETVPDLPAATARFARWAEECGISFAGAPTERGTAPAASAERYLVGPPTEPDWTRWRTEILRLVAG